MAKKKKVHPIVAAATMLPVALGFLGHSKPKPQAPSAPEAVTEEFGAACTLPFDAIKEHHSIDDTCSVDGSSTSGSPQAMQNEAKNNFCASRPPVNVSFTVLRQLQADAAKSGSGITFGSDSQIPKDRRVLRNLATEAGSLSEGDVVRIAAFVIDAHGSNLSTGETVNCKKKGAENNDIHIVLGEKSPTDDECSSVTAEMTPHFRPAEWTPDGLNRNNAHLYRFTGQLFFDASHHPCSGGTGSPKRSSLWEIHPVYDVEICGENNNNCKVDSDENWISFAVYAAGKGEDPSETLLQLPDDISTRFGSRDSHLPNP